jgi:hypothetical protein
MAARVPSELVLFRLSESVTNTEAGGISAFVEDDGVRVVVLVFLAVLALDLRC